MKLSVKIIISSVSIILLIWAVIFAVTGNRGPGKIEIAGSTSAAPMLEILAARYMQPYPGIEIRVNGTGSSDGIQAASTGSSDIGMSSRGLEETERDPDVLEVLAALDAIAIVVHPDNPVRDLGIDQIKAVFTGQVNDWAEIGGAPGKIVVVSREPGSGTRGAFENIISYSGALKAGSYELDGSAAVQAAVARNLAAISYVSTAFLNRNVRAVSVDSVYPSSINVAEGSYPVVRPFYLLYLRELKERNPGAALFLDWVLSAEGQSLIARRWTAVR
ncbi:phosphate ABC transporter substrate-binding protein [Spirochaeta dissipatitropha]